MVAVGGIEGCRTGFGLIGDAVDRWRLPQVVAAVDARSQQRDEEILSVVTSNSVDLQTFHTEVMTNMASLKKRQEKVIDFINSLTNHPPIEWPTDAGGSSVVRLTVKPYE